MGEFNKNIWRGNKAQSDVCIYLLSTLSGGRCTSEEKNTWVWKTVCPTK